MSKGVKLSVKLTLKDIRNFSISKPYRGVLGKIYLGFMILFIILIIFSLLILSLGTKPEESKYLVGTYLLSIVSIVVLPLLPLFYTYLFQSSSYKRIGLLDADQTYELTGGNFRISSPRGNFRMNLSDIYKIQELKPGFLIYTSSTKYFILPRRCFNDTSELNNFLNILASNIEHKKLKLGKTRLSKTA